MGRAVRSSVLAWTAAVWVATGALGHAESARYHAPPVGTLFVLDTGSHRVLESGTDTVTTENAGHARTTWSGGLVTAAMSPEDRARLMGWFPLTAGARFEYGAGSMPAGTQRALVVVGEDVVQVDGRAIPVVRVTRHQVDPAPHAAEGEYTLWFAPEYGFPLKMTYRHISGAAPRFTDWQVVDIVAPGSFDGLWRISLECPGSTFIRFDRARVKNGALVDQGGAHPSAQSLTNTELVFARAGDQVEFRGTAMNASGHSVTLAARGTLTGDTVNGTGTINGRSGCPFTASRL